MANVEYQYHVWNELQQCCSQNSNDDPEVLVTNIQAKIE